MPAYDMQVNIFQGMRFHLRFPSRNFWVKEEKRKKEKKKKQKNAKVK